MLDLEAVSASWSHRLEASMACPVEGLGLGIAGMHCTWSVEARQCAPVSAEEVSVYRGCRPVIFPYHVLTGVVSGPAQLGLESDRVQGRMLDRRGMCEEVQVCSSYLFHQSLSSVVVI